MDTVATTQGRTGVRDASDAVLVGRAGSGDQAAWDELVRRFSGLVWRVARAQGLSRADTGDVHQTTWLRLVENLHTLRTPEAVAGWLATTARREAWRVRGRGTREIAVEETERQGDDDLSLLSGTTPEPGRDLLHRERDGMVRDAFERLSDRDQQLLGLLVQDPPLSYKEISVALDMPVGSIGPTRARCLERLRRELAADGVEQTVLAS